MHRAIYLICVLLLVSCGSEDDSDKKLLYQPEFGMDKYFEGGKIMIYHFYDSDSAKIEYAFEVDPETKQRDGKYISLYKTGKLHSVVQYKQGKIDGNCYIYFANGNIKEKKIYKNDRLSGTIYIYDKINSGVVRKKILVAPCHYDSTMECTDMKIEYDNKGRVISDSSHVKVETDKKDYSIGDDVWVTFTLTDPVFDHCILHTGYYANNFKLEDSLHYKVSAAWEGHSCKMRYKATSKGFKCIRGVMEDVKIVEEENGFAKSYRSNKFLYEKYFYVK